jgi:hypothetical protein
MKNAAAVRDATLVAGLTVVAVTAFATNGAVVSEAAWIPAPKVAELTTPAGRADAVPTGIETLTETTGVRFVQNAIRPRVGGSI